MLVKVILPGGEPVEYEYDGNQRLISRKSSDGVDNFVQSGWDIVTKMDDVGKRTYYTGSSAVESEDSVKYFHYNHRGDTVLVTDANGEIFHNLNYEAYGKPSNSEGIPINNLSLANSTSPTGSASGNLPNLFVGASGIRYDTKTNLHYMRFRWFSSSQLRFISPDLLMDLNRYVYVSGNPLRYIDVLGLAEDIGSERANFYDRREKAEKRYLTDYTVGVDYNPPGIAPLIDAMITGVGNFLSGFSSNEFSTRFTPDTDDLYRNFKAYNNTLKQIDEANKFNSAYSYSAVITVPIKHPYYIGGGCEIVYLNKKVRYYGFPVFSIATGPSNSISKNWYRGLRNFDQLKGFAIVTSYSPRIIETSYGFSPFSNNGPESFSFGINPTVNEHGYPSGGGSVDIRYYFDLTFLPELYENFWK